MCVRPRVCSGVGKSYQNLNVKKAFKIHSFYMWNLKNNVNEQTKQKQAHRYGEQTDGCRSRGVRGLRKKGEWIKKYKVVVTKQS